MMVALLLYGYWQGERSSRQIERRCVRDVAYQVIVGGLHADHATIACSAADTRRRWVACSARCCGCSLPKAWCRSGS